MRILAPLAFGILLLFGWEVAVIAAGIPAYILPGPSAIATALIQNASDLAAALAVTLQVTVAALALAAVTGGLAALALAQSRLAERIFFPYAIFLQVTPIVTIAPFVIIWVENVFLVLLILAWMAAIFPIISNTLLGLKSVDTNLQDLFRLYGASRWQTVRRLMIPSALTYFLGGLRIAGGLALIGAVVAEMVAGTSGARTGLASRLVEASYRLELAVALGCFALLSVSGLALYLALDAFSKRLLRHWHESARTNT